MIGIAALAGAVIIFALDHAGSLLGSPSLRIEPRREIGVMSPAALSPRKALAPKAPALPVGTPLSRSELGSRAWLVGAWGPNIPLHVAKIMACDTENIVLFGSDGTYHDGGSEGRYRYDGRKVTYYDRILVDEADGREDRSEYDQPLTAIIKPIGPNVMSEDGSVAYRCDAG